jgi:hypothetical protein
MGAFGRLEICGHLFLPGNGNSDAWKDATFVAPKTRASHSRQLKGVFQLKEAEGRIVPPLEEPSTH